MPDLFEQPHISKATIARLYNLGNFEHTRYELTVEIPRNASAGSVIRELDMLLADMDPRPPYSLHSIYAAQKNSARTDDEGLAAAARDVLVKQNEWERRREAAFRKFTALGGSEKTLQQRDQDDEAP